ncbi:MAG: DUF5717 family protein [Lachnospiraceae bacterium]|nr:DUF5717 family protein [Lachnospiraceae bacterium]
MKKVIDHILEGDFHPGKESLGFSPSQVGNSIAIFAESEVDGEVESRTLIKDEIEIEAEVYPGKEYQGAFRIYGPPGLLTEGYVHTHHPAVELYTHEFTGAEAEIAYCLHTANFTPGENEEGEFTIVSNHGEYTIPFRIFVAAHETSSSIGTIRNLFHFTNLAKSNWYEALALFHTADFPDLVARVDNSRQYAAICRGLSAAGKESGGSIPFANEQHMEEFLLTIKKKQKIDYLVKEAAYTVSAPSEPTEYVITVTRNGWGHTALSCSAAGGFLELEKTMLRDEDFLANVAKLPFYINEENLLRGRNFGCIHLRDVYSDISIPVTVTVPFRGGSKKKHHETRQATLKLMNLYIAFRAKQMSQSAWRKETEQLVDRLIVADDGALLPKLYRVHLLITDNRIADAGRLLNHADNMLQGHEREWPELWCYYIYLTTLENRDASLTNQVTGEVERFYSRHRGNIWIGWLLCHLREEYMNSPVKKWQFMKELGNNKQCSPIVLVEAWLLLSQHQSLLTRLEEFEIQLLLFAVKRKLLFKGIIPQIVYLISSSKNYSHHFERILADCHDVAPTDATVQAMCELLVKRGRSEANDRIWYQRGIERGIKVTRLFEHFLYSLDDNLYWDDITTLAFIRSQIPKQVLLYFGLNHEIPPRQQAFLYAFVHQSRDELPEIYANYHAKIERFVAHELGRNRNSPSLAYLFEQFLQMEMVNGENASALVEILFTARVEALRADIIEVIVFYEKAQAGVTYGLSGGKGEIVLYGDNYHLILVDAHGNRYANPADYRVKRRESAAFAMIADTCIPWVYDRVGFDLWICEDGDKLKDITRSNVAACKRLLGSKFLRYPYQEELLMNLLRYYYASGESEEIEQMLTSLSPQGIEKKYHEDILRMMVARQMHHLAYDWLAAMGGLKVDAKLIMRIISSKIQETAILDDPVCVNYAYMAFRAGKYDEAILECLCAAYQGRVKDLRDIWRAGQSFGIDTHYLAERLLLQSVFSSVYIRERDEILAEYIRGGGRSDVIMAYVKSAAADYFLMDKITDVIIMGRIERLCDSGMETDIICQLAYLKYYSQQRDDIDSEVHRYLAIFLQKMLDKGIYFAFFKEYMDILPLVGQLLDKTIIEYNTVKAGCYGFTPYIRSHCGPDHIGSSSADWLSRQSPPEAMQEMYPGIFVKQYILLPGEWLSYEIEVDDRVVFSERIQVKVPEFMPESRFARLGAIETARAAGDYGAAAMLMSDYQQLEFMTEAMFKPLSVE